MLQIKLKLSRYQENFIKYTGDADKFLELPILIDKKVIGAITSIISDTEDYIEVEGLLYRVGVDYFKNDNIITPAGITILTK